MRHKSETNLPEPTLTQIPSSHLAQVKSDSNPTYLPILEELKRVCLAMRLPWQENQRPIDSNKWIFTCPSKNKTSWTSQAFSRKKKDGSVMTSGKIGASLLLSWMQKHCWSVHFAKVVAEYWSRLTNTIASTCLPFQQQQQLLLLWVPRSWGLERSKCKQPYPLSSTSFKLQQMWAQLGIQFEPSQLYLLADLPAFSKPPRKQVCIYHVPIEIVSGRKTCIFHLWKVPHCPRDVI